MNQPVAASTPSLVQILRGRYLGCLQSSGDPRRWKILVLDTETQARLNTVAKMYDVLELSVQQVELIGNNRSAFPKVEAVYILAPTRENVLRILRDFEPARPAQPATRKTPAVPAHPGPKYAAAHIYFIDALPDADCNALLESPARDYIRTFQDIYVNFWPLESHVFSLKYPESFFTLYGPATSVAKDCFAEYDSDLDFMAQSLVNVCASLSEFPEIRYYDPTSISREPMGRADPSSKKGGKVHLAAVLAKKVHLAMQQYCRDNEGFPPETGRPRGVLLITDRTMDLAAPFVHEFTYQAMCHDLLKIEDGNKYHHSFRNNSGVVEEQDIILNDDDKVWCDVKHMHMKDALDNLVAAFKQFNTEHGGQTGTSINDLKDMLANLPGMKESKEKLSLHLSLAEQCMNLFEQRKLPVTASVEQCCATGVNAEGKTPKTLVEEMVPLLDDRSLSLKDKVRIIVLFIMYRDGVEEEDRKRLYQHARLGLPEIDAISNLKYLGQDITKESRKSRKQPFKHRPQEDAYDISRFQPAVKSMLEEHIAGKLDRSTFPYIGIPAPTAGGSLRSDSSRGVSVSAPTSLRSTRAEWVKGTKSGPRIENKQRMIVFVAGGATYSEVRAAYQVGASSSKDVYIGSTHLITPESFIADLTRLERGRTVAQGRPDLIRPSQSPPQASRNGGYDQSYEPRSQQQHSSLPTPGISYSSSRQASPQPRASPQPTYQQQAPLQQQQMYQQDPRQQAPSGNGNTADRYNQWQAQNPARPQVSTGYQSSPSVNMRSVANDDFVPGGANIHHARTSVETGNLRPVPSSSSLGASSTASGVEKKKKSGFLKKLI